VINWAFVPLATLPSRSLKQQELAGFASSCSPQHGGRPGDQGILSWPLTGTSPMVKVSLWGDAHTHGASSPLHGRTFAGPDLEHALGDAMAQLDRFVARTIGEGSETIEEIRLRIQLGGSYTRQEVGQLWRRLAWELWSILAVAPESVDPAANTLPLFDGITLADTPIAARANSAEGSSSSPEKGGSHE
jgi:hypothetical protein